MTEHLFVSTPACEDGHAIRHTICMNARVYMLGLVLLTGCAPASSPSSEDSDSIGEGWSQGNSLRFDGRTRSYAMYVPAEGELVALVVVLHGGGDSVRHMISEIAVESSADANGLVVTVPAGVDGGWNDEDPPGDGLPDDVGFIDALVTEIQTVYPSLPSHQVFAYGFSNGGGLATRLACESSLIRGVGVIGNYYVSPLGDCPRRVGHPVPGWFGAGLEDDLVPVESVRETMPSYVADLTECPTTGSLQPTESADVPSAVVCKQVSDCDMVRLCEYDDHGHEMLPGSLLAAWSFLSEAVGAGADEG